MFREIKVIMTITNERFVTYMLGFMVRRPFGLHIGSKWTLRWQVVTAPRRSNLRPNQDREAFH